MYGIGALVWLCSRAERQHPGPTRPGLLGSARQGSAHENANYGGLRLNSEQKKGNRT